MVHNVAKVPEWDFRVFWMYGQLATRGANVYDPAEFRHFGAAFQPDAEFKEEVLNVGATYPPSAMFLFLPLGWFDVHAAYCVWFLVQTCCLILSMYLLQRLFLGSGLPELAVSALLVFGLRSTWSTIQSGQTNFLLLFLLLLYWRDRKLGRAGIWLTIAIAVKLYVLAMIIDILLGRKWRALAWTAASSIILWVASLVLLGTNTFFTYFAKPPTSRLPNWVYTEQMNQSMLGVILRSRWHAPSVSQPLFLVLALSLTCATVWLRFRADKDAAGMGLLSTTIMGLIIYPGTLTHYSAVLILPLMAIWASRDRLRGKSLGCAFLIALVYACVGSTEGNSVFIAILLTWFSVAAAAPFEWKTSQVSNLDAAGISA